jgi:hypothetical protein
MFKFHSEPFQMTQNNIISTIKKINLRSPLYYLREIVALFLIINTNINKKIFYYLNI